MRHSAIESGEIERAEQVGGDDRDSPTATRRRRRPPGSTRQPRSRPWSAEALQRRAPDHRQRGRQAARHLERRCRAFPADRRRPRTGSCTCDRPSSRGQFALPCCLVLVGFGEHQRERIRRRCRPARGRGRSRPSRACSSRAHRSDRSPRPSGTQAARHCLRAGAPRIVPAPRRRGSTPSDCRRRHRIPVAVHAAVVAADPHDVAGRYAAYAGEVRLVVGRPALDEPIDQAGAVELGRHARHVRAASRSTGTAATPDRPRHRTAGGCRVDRVRTAAGRGRGRR